LKADELKKEGNKALGAKNYEEAISKYSAAIALNEDAVYFSNRAAAYSQCGRHEDARADALKALEVDPSFSKAYSRLGHAEFCLGSFKEAVEAYEKGLDKDPNNQSLKQSLAAAKAKLNETAPVSRNAGGAAGGMPGFGGMGGMPDFSKMASDPNFMKMAQSMMQNPAIANMMNSPEIRNMMSGAGGGMPDMASLMNNPQIAAMANNLMSDPSAMSSLLNNPDVADMAKKYMDKK
jgi:small glutamine-rich tetratricopeptide repeat-containing protein alpha